MRGHWHAAICSYFYDRWQRFAKPVHNSGNKIIASVEKKKKYALLAVTGGETRDRGGSFAKKSQLAASFRDGWRMETEWKFSTFFCGDARTLLFCSFCGCKITTNHFLCVRKSASLPLSVFIHLLTFHSPFLLMDSSESPEPKTLNTLRLEEPLSSMTSPSSSSSSYSSSSSS